VRDRVTGQATMPEDVGTLFPRVGAWSVTGTNRRHRSHQATGALRSAGWTSAPQYWQRWVSDGVGRDGSVGTGVTVGGVVGKPDHRQSGGCTAVSRIPGLFGVLVRKLSPAAILRPFFAGMNPKVPTW